MSDLLTLRIRAPHYPGTAFPTAIVPLVLPGGAHAGVQNIWTLAGITHPNAQDGYYFRFQATVDCYIVFGPTNAVVADATCWPLLATEIAEFWIQPGEDGSPGALPASDNFFDVYSALAGHAVWYLG
jgi:hypothetical protein